MHLMNGVHSVAAEPLIRSIAKGLMEAGFQPPFTKDHALTTGNTNISGGDTLRGNTRSHPEHDG